jgi:hypothetical protein
LAILDLAIGSTLRYYYFKENSGLHYRTTFAVDSTDADVLIFGSSPANHHYVTELFEQQLNLISYNCGRDGNSFLYSYAVFRSIIRRHIPKIVIFDLNPGELIYDSRDYDRLSSLLPYCKTHPEINNIVELRSPWEKLKLRSQIYPFNSGILTIITGNLEFNRIRKADALGYVPLSGHLPDTVLQRFTYYDGKMDPNKINAVNDIKTFCANNNILLILIESPLYAEVNRTKSSIYFSNLKSGKNLIFKSYLNQNEYIGNSRLFNDEYHLNDEGARYFTAKVIQTIKDLN